MDWARAKFMEFQQMQVGSVTFMLAERILRKLCAKVTHHPVPHDLGDHAGGSDDWTGQRTAAGFVNPGNAHNSGGTQFLFVTKSAAPIHLRKSLANLRE